MPAAMHPERAYDIGSGTGTRLTWRGGVAGRSWRPATPPGLSPEGYSGVLRGGHSADGPAGHACAAAEGAAGLVRMIPNMSLLKLCRWGVARAWGVARGVSGQTPVCPGERHVLTLGPAAGPSQ
ncbi:hypothetical protein GCM10010279_24240 [Streptomyces mutabilis]|nr:hypothetical protein GCM10010279_24240 [Streptomyces mutabilis]